MKEFFEQLNSVLSIVAAISDFLWEVPTNWEWYKAIPVFGSFSLAVIVLVGTGIYFSIRLGFIQVRQFKRGMNLLIHRRAASTGISPLAAFFLSSAMRDVYKRQSTRGPEWTDQWCTSHGASRAAG